MQVLENYHGEVNNSYKCKDNSYCISKFRAYKERFNNRKNNFNELRSFINENYKNKKNKILFPTLRNCNVFSPETFNKTPECIGTNQLPPKPEILLQSKMLPKPQDQKTGASYNDSKGTYSTQYKTLELPKAETVDLRIVFHSTSSGDYNKFP
ncbi:hypothetical protein PMALA_080790 [Plasmodium malariae]|uniref:PIR Superfamily Protein n=1 Tax=Plasmodium malariae TaxID=5858 RepID=A0A1A8X7K4_PLAMA|nr:hypothetical protein PMALA_080790 [Plasmodium malariae]